MSFMLAVQPCPAHAASDAERWHKVLSDAWWVGPLLTPGAESPEQGHGAIAPYLFDNISGGKSHPGTLAYFIYGLTDAVTVGIRPTFAIGTDRTGPALQMADWKLLSHVRLTHFRPEHRVPSIAIALLEALPSGRYDRLTKTSQGQGSGFFSTELGLQVQDYFLLRGARPLRVRFNLFHSFPSHAKVRGQSVYGTDSSFRGKLLPGHHTSADFSLEYSIAKRWVGAIELIWDAQGRTRVRPREDRGVAPADLTYPRARQVSFAPNVEYSWSKDFGMVAAVRITPGNRQSRGSITPAIAFSRSF